MAMDGLKTAIDFSPSVSGCAGVAVSGIFESAGQSRNSILLI